MILVTRFLMEKFAKTFEKSTCILKILVVHYMLLYYGLLDLKMGQYP